MGTLGNKFPRLRNAKEAPGYSVRVFVNSESTAKMLIIFKGSDNSSTGRVAVGMGWPRTSHGRASGSSPGARDEVAWHTATCQQSYQVEQASNRGRWLCSNRRMSQKCQRPGRGNLAVGARAVTDDEVLPWRGQDT